MNGSIQGVPNQVPTVEEGCEVAVRPHTDPALLYVLESMRSELHYF